MHDELDNDSECHQMALLRSIKHIRRLYNVFNTTHVGTQLAAPRMLSTWYVLWSLVGGRRSLVVGRWSLVIGPWSCVLGHWSLVVCPWSVVVGPCILTVSR